MKRNKNEYRHDGDHREAERRTIKQRWMYVGVAVLIILLLIWLTIADFWGDTDVAAFIVP